MFGSRALPAIASIRRQEAGEPPMTSQQWDAARYAGNAGFVPVLGRPVLEWLDPRPGERILDLGCGDGALTAELAATGARVLGVDASPQLIEAARGRGLDVRLMDGHALTFDAAFDAVFSNAALHWMTRPAAVAEGVARALVPGGRFVGEFGAHGNVAAIIVALVAVLRRRGVADAAAVPWYFPTAEAYTRLLESAGFTVERVEIIPRPTPLPTGMTGWLTTFADPFLTRLPAGERAEALAEAVELLRPALCDEAGRWIADYVRLRFAARRAG